MMQQGVDQRSVAVAGGGMDHQPGRLVDHQQMLVFIDDRQRDFLRLVVGGLRVGKRQREALVAFHLDRRIAYSRAVTGQSAGLGQHLEAFA